MSKAYVLLSGGIDSSTVLALAIQQHGSARAVTLHYGQRHSVEIAHAHDIAKHFGVGHDIIDISNIIGRGGLSDPNLEVPDVSYADLPYGVSPTYVPFRNGLMLSVLASRASADPDAKAIYYGAHAEDAENDAYPDCSKAFVSSMEDAIEIGTYGKLSLQTPFVSETKAHVVRVGESLHVPWKITWSCYKGGLIHCGLCPTCRARRQAFVQAGVTDPTDYEVDHDGGDV